MVDPVLQPFESPGASRQRIRISGTSMMLMGTSAAAVGSIVFQVVGGRALGDDAFAAVAVIWTLLFLSITIFLIPVEQLIIRKLTLGGGHGSAVRGSWPVIALVVGGASALAIGFVVVAESALLEGDRGFVLVAALMFPLHALMMVGRGFLAGRGRFVAYGVVVGLDAFGKAGGAVLVAIAGLGPVAYGWALALSPVTVLLLRPFREEAGAEPTELTSVLPRSDRRFMTGYLIATASSQAVLAAGPLVVGALGASGAAISVFFVTTTLFRGPMSASYNLLARILPGFTRRAAAGDHDAINRLVRNLAAVGAVGAAVVGSVAALAGPAVVEIIFGSDFRPSAKLAALAAAGVIFGIVGLATSQVLVGRGATDRMAVAWLVAVVAATAAIFVVDADPEIRVVAGFLVGEAVAFAGLTISALVKPRSVDLAPASESTV